MKEVSEKWGFCFCFCLFVFKSKFFCKRISCFYGEVIDISQIQTRQPLVEIGFCQ